MASHTTTSLKFHTFTSYREEIEALNTVANRSRMIQKDRTVGVEKQEGGYPKYPQNVHL